ncbi:MAG TPA: hypothetical protein VGL19_03345, partial [Polyangiaceae bacterium]
MNWAGLRRRDGRCGAALLGACALCACGGGVPLLHPAHVLNAGQTSFGAGMSDRLLLGSEQRALGDAQRRAPGAPLPAGDPAYTRGVLVAVAEGPALAPWASARVGIPGSNEAGLSFTGQALRLDARHAFQSQNSAWSVGLGLTDRGFGQSALELPGTDLKHPGGVGLDLPLLFGYHTDAELISIWAGARAAYDHWSGAVTLDAAAPFELSAARLSAGPVLGLAVGLPPLWVAAEVEVDYSHVTGTLGRSASELDARFDGWSVRPAGALIVK